MVSTPESVHVAPPPLGISLFGQASVRRPARDVANLTATDVTAGFDELLDRRILRQAGARMHHDYVFTHHLVAVSHFGDHSNIRVTSWTTTSPT